MMKKVGIITIHNAYNYGAVLQAYATQDVVSSFVSDCEIIDYDAKKFRDSRKIFLPIISAGNIIHNIRSVIYLKSIIKRIKNFKSFMNRRYKLSSIKYHSEDDFTNLDYDFVITGSDQTFCLHLRGNQDEMKPFFLDNVMKKKISYASSMGEKISDITDEEKEWMANRFNEYSCLAVREENTAKYIESLTGRRPEVVLDPTLLLTKEKWDELASTTKYDKNNYILFYTVLSDKWVVDYVTSISKITGLKVIAIHHHNRFEFKSSFVRADYSGPCEFISLIKNAKLVITTSFHATVFSVIYNIPFYSLLLGEGNRISSILNDLNLKNRIIKENFDKKLINADFNLDFTQANQLLDVERQRSFKYLKKALEIEDKNEDM